MSRVAIMQPYFLPYVGYFQLIKNVDRFIIYDEIEFTKKGWINRNRILMNGEPSYITIPLEKKSDYANVCERTISVDFRKDKIINKIKGAYNKAPFYECVMPLFIDIMEFNSRNLFDFILNSIQKICLYLDINTLLIASSEIEISSDLRGQDRVLGLCQRIGADRYLNPIGGVDLYDGESFRAKGVELEFLKTRSLPYEQFGRPFQPALSIVDVMMFNSPHAITVMLDEGFDILDENGCYGI